MRVVLVRRLRARLDPLDPRSDLRYDLLVVLASSVWGVAPIALHGWLTPLS